MLFQMIFSFLLIFVWLPMLVISFDEDDRGWIDKLFISIIHSTFFFIVVIHLLALVKLYETISLLAVYILTMITVTWFNSRHQSTTIGTKILIGSYDMFDNPGNLNRYIQNIPGKLRNSSLKVANTFLSSFRIHWFVYTCIIVTLSYAAYTRFKHSLIHLYFGASDPYVHLQMSKFLGENEIFKDGIYPLGFASVISALHKFFIMDPYIIVRFIGPL